VDLGGSDAFDRGKVEGFERFDFGKPPVMEALADHRFMTRRLLRGRDLVEIHLVRPVGVARLTRRRLESARDVGQL
jgi:hypothetical protein